MTNRAKGKGIVGFIVCVFGMVMLVRWLTSDGDSDRIVHRPAPPGKIYSVSDVLEKRKAQTLAARAASITEHETAPNEARLQDIAKKVSSLIIDKRADRSIPFECADRGGFGIATVTCGPIDENARTMDQSNFELHGSDR